MLILPTNKLLYFLRTFIDIFRKNLLAFLLGPLAIIPAMIVYAVAFKFIDPEANYDQGSVALLFIIFGLLVAYPVTLIIGLPCSVLLEKFGKFNLINLLIVTAGFYLCFNYGRLISRVSIYLVLCSLGRMWLLVFL